MALNERSFDRALKKKRLADTFTIRAFPVATLGRGLLSPLAIRVRAVGHSVSDFMLNQESSLAGRREGAGVMSKVGEAADLCRS